MRIFGGGGFWEKESNDNGWSKTAFGVHIFGSFRNKANIIIRYYIIYSLIGFPLTPKDDLEWFWMAIIL